jgi:mono/diheme cytochrome c family protein
MRHIRLFVVLTMAALFSLTSLAMTGATNHSSSRSAPELYAKYCVSCHGKDGRANSLKGKLKHARNLTDPAWQDRVSDERLFNSITNGKEKMPGFSKKMSEQEINTLVSYVRSLKK